MVTTQTGQKARKLSHDKIFKYLIRLFFQDYIGVLGWAIGAALDFGEVVFPSGETFAELKKDGHLSLDFVARLRRRRIGPNTAGAPVVVHSEIEGRFRSDMALRMWKYFVNLAALHLDAAIVPVVLYLKGGPPGVQEHEAESRIGDLVSVRFRYLSFGLSGCLAEEWLRDKPQTLVAALAACMRSKIWDPVEHKLQCMRRVLEEKDPAKQYLLTQVVENYLKLSDDENARFKAAFAQETQTMVPFPLTFEEALVEKEARGIAVGEARGIAVGEARGIAAGEARGIAVGEARGIAVGEARGIVLGEARGIREAILQLLSLRFGDVPASLTSRLIAISELDRLKRVFARAAEAPSLAEIESVLA